MIDTNQTLETIVLLNLLNDECKCEKKYHDNYECTHLAVAKLTFQCDTFSPLVCQSVVTLYWEGCEIGDWCDGCKKPVSECWSIRPV